MRAWKRIVSGIAVTLFTLTLGSAVAQGEFAVVFNPGFSDPRVGRAMSEYPGFIKTLSRDWEQANKTNWGRDSGIWVEEKLFISQDSSSFVHESVTYRWLPDNPLAMSKPGVDLPGKWVVDSVLYESSGGEKSLSEGGAKQYYAANAGDGDAGKENQAYQAYENFLKNWDPDLTQTPAPSLSPPPSPSPTPSPKPFVVSFLEIFQLLARNADNVSQDTPDATPQATQTPPDNANPAPVVPAHWLQGVPAPDAGVFTASGVLEAGPPRKISCDITYTDDERTDYINKLHTLGFSDAPAERYPAEQYPEGTVFLTNGEYDVIIGPSQAFGAEFISVYEVGK